VGVAFARPLVLLHSATGTRRCGNRFSQTSASLFFRFHKKENVKGRIANINRLQLSSRPWLSIMLSEPGQLDRINGIDWIRI
jgi:hypothetical protein